MHQNKKGKLIVIEGTDGSGKKTQTAKLLERLMFSWRRIGYGRCEPVFSPLKCKRECDLKCKSRYWCACRYESRNA